VTVTEFRFVVLDDPVLTVLSIAGLLCFVGGAVMRLRGGRRWDRVLLIGALLMAAAFVYTLVSTWLSPPR
jgi:hypothetical protein